MITRDLIAALAPRPAGKKREAWDAYVEALTSDETRGRLGLAGINTELRMVHLLAQWLHECGGCTVLWEDMHYRAKRIEEKFGGKWVVDKDTGERKWVWVHSACVSSGEAVRLAGLPEALAERVYGLGNPAKAAELGNTEPGDGYRYRGFGIGQITGKRDHERLLKGETTAQASINAAIQEWTEKGCNRRADRDDLEGITKKINGGLNGLEDRKAWLVKCKAALKGQPIENAAPVRLPEPTLAEPAKLEPRNPEVTLPESNPAVTPAPSLSSVAVRSKSIWALVNAKLLLVFGFLTEIGRDALDWIAKLFGAVPQAANEAIGLSEQGQKLSGLIGFNWQKVAFTVALGCLAVAMVRHVRDKRELETLREKP